jgi:hypothetical protein
MQLRIDPHQDAPMAEAQERIGHWQKGQNAMNDSSPIDLPISRSLP